MTGTIHRVDREVKRFGPFCPRSGGKDQAIRPTGTQDKLEACPTFKDGTSLDRRMVQTVRSRRDRVVWILPRSNSVKHQPGIAIELVAVVLDDAGLGHGLVGQPGAFDPAGFTARPLRPGSAQ